MQRNGAHLFSLIVGLVAVSTSAILIKLCASAPAVIAFYRLAGAGALMFAGAAMARHNLVLQRRELGIAALAALFLTAHFYFWMASLFMTSINSAVVLLATQPIFALILQSTLGRHRITAINVGSLLLGLLGAGVIARTDLLHSVGAGLGDLWSIVSAAFAAAYLFTSSHRRAALLPFLAWLYSMAALMMLVIGLVRHDSFQPAIQRDWLWFALLVLSPTLVGHTLLNRATQHFPTYVVNLSILAEPVITAFFAWIVFSERVTLNVWTGGVLIIVAVAIEFVPFRSSLSTA